MNKNWLKQNFLFVFFILFVAVYATLLLIDPRLGPTDDYMFLRTLQNGKLFLPYSQNFPYFDTAKLGRFSPLAAMEYNLFGLFFKSPSPFLYYFYHAVQFTIFAVLIVKLLSKFTTNKFLFYGVPALFFLTPGVVISWFRMQMNERNVIFFLAAFFLCYLAYFDKRKIIYFISTIFFANLVIYSKETTFIAIGVFVFFHLVFSWKIFDKRVKILDGLLMLSSFLYVAIYYFYVYLHRGPNVYGGINFNLLTFIKNFLNYGFFSDPMLILILLPLTIWRISKVFFQRQEAHPVYDSMLLTASTYIAAFFVLNMYGPYYLLPAYILALPPLIYFFSQRQPKIIFWKIFGGITALFFIVNVLPSGLHYLTYYKYLPVNFNKTLDLLIQDINSKYPSQRANIFLDGVDRGTGRGTYFVLAEFLRFKDLSDKQFDLKSNVKTEKALPLISEIPIPFTVFETNAPDEIKNGDYLIVSPQSTRINPTKTYLESLKKDYELVFQTRSRFAFPNFNLKTLVKYLLSKKISKGQKSSGIIVNENLMNRPDYYVFVKR
mgnify:CR=1 FL=1